MKLSICNSPSLVSVCFQYSHSLQPTWAKVVSAQVYETYHHVEYLVAVLVWTSHLNSVSSFLK